MHPNGFKRKLNPEQCQDFPEWKVGAERQTATGDIQNYWSCAQTVDIDGYDVLIMPKGVVVYHGSSVLAEHLVRFPVGPAFYQESNIQGIPPSELELVARDPSTIEEYISTRMKTQSGQSIRIMPSWYSNPRVALQYTIPKPGENDRIREACVGHCVFAYLTKRDIKLLRIDSEHNINILLSHSNMTDTVRDAIGFMLQIDVTRVERPFGETVFARKRDAVTAGRLSVNVVDTLFTDWLCQNMPKLDGYCAADITLERRFGALPTGQAEVVTTKRFHGEMALCNPFNLLSRNYDSPQDWQHMNLTGAPQTVRQFMGQLSLYETINNNFHSGNLFEHSIWTLLSAEKFFAPMAPQSPAVYMYGCFLAFIHDIGKMVHPKADGTSTEVYYNVARQKYIYFDVRDHPQIGARYWMSDSIPLMNPAIDPFSPVGYLSPQQMARDMGIILIPEWVMLGSVALSVHRVFGEMLLKPLNNKVFERNSNAYNTSIASYVLQVIALAENSLGANLTSSSMRTLITLCMIVSNADISATQPVDAGTGRTTDANLKNRLNRKSSIWPYISNVSKRYSGARFPLSEPLVQDIFDYSKSL